MLRLDVHPPLKAPDRYEFQYDLVGRPPRSGGRHRLSSALRWLGGSARTRLRFGFRATNFTIAHADVWDSVFPLMFLTRNGGPLFKSGHEAAIIRFRYPIHEGVRRFYVTRAAQCGLSITVEADTFERVYDIRGTGGIEAFGGGKESRLLFGLLRELGRTPRLTVGGVHHRPPDLPMADISEALAGSLAEKVMPGLMAGAAHFYLGGALNEVHLHRPWHQYYDIASFEGQHGLTTLFQELGVELTLHAPLNVIAANLVQLILSVRYPDLAAYQRSQRPGRSSEKNLHVALAKIHHGLSFSAHCSDELFRQLLRTFVEEKLARPDDCGFNGHRELFHREMMAIIARHRDGRLFEDIRSVVPEKWSASWIDFIHVYVRPSVESSLLEIIRHYASDYEPRPGQYRIPVPGDTLP